MSPVAKSKAPFSDAQIRKWWKRHYVSYDGGTPDWNMTPFSRLVRLVDKFADEVQALRRAMHAPMAPGAARTIARIGKILGTHTNSEGAVGIAHYDSEIESYGEAIDWHLRGEPEEEVEVERARVTAVRRQDEEYSATTPEKREEYGALHTEHAVVDLIATVLATGRWEKSVVGPIAPRSIEQRREIVERLCQALLGEDAKSEVRP